MKKTIKYHMLTLLELIVALGIVAALASLFLDNMADTKARACEDQTIEKGEAVQAVITGGEARGFSDFLSDMGRWPRVYIPEEGDEATKGGRRLAEFYDPTVWYQDDTGSSKSALSHAEMISGVDIQKILSSVEGSTFPKYKSNPAPGESSFSYPDVTMTVGWRGPYLNLSRPQGGKFFDGWGRAWQIITNYNRKTEGNHLLENRSDADKILVKAAQADFTDRTNHRWRIDGILSYGGDGQPGGTGASDADQEFIFGHPMDSFNSTRLASLNIRMKVKDADGNWQPIAGPPFTKFWEKSVLYKVGDFVNREVSAGSESVPHLFVCRKEHTSETSWDGTYWIDLTDKKTSISPWDPVSDNGKMFADGDLRIVADNVWVKNGPSPTANISEVKGTEWTKLFAVTTVADSLSILLFVPVMQGSGDSRYIKLGHYHFYANSYVTNFPGVLPEFLDGSTLKRDTDMKVSEKDRDNFSSNHLKQKYENKYNPRYLVAETVWRSWSELQVERLVPGRRKIFCAFNNKTTGTFQTSEVQWLDLKPGDNFIELYLK